MSRRRSSIFHHGADEPNQLLRPGRRQVQNGNLYIGHVELKQETSACLQLVSFAAFVLTTPRLWLVVGFMTHSLSFCHNLLKSW